MHCFLTVGVKTENIDILAWSVGTLKSLLDWYPREYYPKTLKKHVIFMAMKGANGISRSTGTPESTTPDHKKPLKNLKNMTISQTKFGLAPWDFDDFRIFKKIGASRSTSQNDKKS